MPAPKPLALFLAFLAACVPLQPLPGQDLQRQAWGQDAGDGLRVQLLSALNRQVAAAGEPFMLEVEAYLSGGPPEAVAQAAEALATATLALPEDLHLLRSTLEQKGTYEPAFEDSVWVLTRTFALRAEVAGAVTVPPLRLEAAGQTYQTRSHLLHTYQVQPAFYRVASAIMPLVVEVPGVQPGRFYARNGTAFLLAPDVLVTSYHVVMDARRIRAVLPDGKRLVIKKAWVLDAARDVAVLYVNPRAVQRAGLTPLTLAPLPPGGTPAEAEPVVFTYGWPNGTQRSTAGLQHHGVTLGEARLWVSTNPVRPGDSGGPVLNAQGQVLGVVTAGTTLQRRRDVLREEVSLATDPRPALQQRLLARKPRRLRSYFRDAAFQAQPHVQAQRLSGLLSTGRRNIPMLAAWLEALDASLSGLPREDPALFFMQGVIHQMVGRPDEAADAYQTALQVFEDYFPAAYMLALHHLRQRHYGEAARLFGHTAQYRPYAHLSAYGLALAEMGRLHYGQAEAHLRAVLAYDLHFAPALFHLARCRIAQGDPAAARQLLARLNDLNTDWAERLRQMLRYPLLQPVTLTPQPPAQRLSLGS